MNNAPINISVLGGLLRNSSSKRLAANGTTSSASTPGTVATSARWNVSSPKWSSRYKLTKTGTDTQPNPSAVKAKIELLYVRICMIRWYAAPIEIGGAPSVLITSPIVSFCSY